MDRETPIRKTLDRVLKLIGGDEIRVTFDQAKAVKKAMENGDKYIQVQSSLDGEAFISISSIYGIFIDRSQKYSGDEAHY